MNYYQWEQSNPPNSLDPNGLRGLAPEDQPTSRDDPRFREPPPPERQPWPDEDRITGAVGALLGVLVEPVDWVMTGIEIIKDPTNPLSYAGLIPFVPSGLGKCAKKFRRGSSMPIVKGPRGGSLAEDLGNGKGTIRDFDQNGRALRDYDFDNMHPESGNPHAHDWDHSGQKPQRGEHRPLRPNE